MLIIKVLGSGCANCKALTYLAQRAVTQLGLDARIEKVTDYADIGQYPLLSTPGLVINEKLVSAGRVPTEAEIITWLTNALEADTPAAA